MKYDFSKGQFAIYCKFGQQRVKVLDKINNTHKSLTVCKIINNLNKYYHGVLLFIDPNSKMIIGSSGNTENVLNGTWTSSEYMNKLISDSGYTNRTITAEEYLDSC